MVPEERDEMRERAKLHATRAEKKKASGSRVE